MSSLNMLFFGLFGFFATRVLSSGDHEECACEYEELNLTMNCTSEHTMKAGVSFGRAMVQRLVLRW